MPIMSRKDYDEMKRGSKAMQDSLQEMIQSGYTPEPLPQAEKPSAGGFLGHLKEKAGQVLDRVTRPKRLIDIGQKARSLGANMRYLADMNKESSTDRGGMTAEKMGRLTGERKKRMEE
jgi:hypothetical protein